MGTGSFPGIKSGQGVTLTPHPLLVPCPVGRTACTEPHCPYKGALIRGEEMWECRWFKGCFGLDQGSLNSLQGTFPDCSGAYTDFYLWVFWGCFCRVKRAAM